MYTLQNFVPSFWKQILVDINLKNKIFRSNFISFYINIKHELSQSNWQDNQQSRAKIFHKSSCIHDGTYILLSKQDSFLWRNKYNDKNKTRISEH